MLVLLPVAFALFLAAVSSQRDPVLSPPGGFMGRALAGVPPAQVCDSEALSGPTSRPRGAVVVGPSRNLGDVARSHGRGTTFWLAPGIYRLGGGEFDQVGPRSGQTFVGAAGAVVDGQNRNRYAFGGRASNVTLKYLTIRNFVAPRDEGVVNHDSGAGWRIEHNTIERNSGAGLMIGSNNVVRGNCIRANGQYGFNAFHPGGVRDVILERNEIAGNNTDDWESREPGCGCTGGGKFWETVGATIAGNWIHDNRGVGLWADTNNSGFVVQENLISDNWDVGLFYEISYNAKVRSNRFERNGLVAGPENPGFPTGAIYLSESGSDLRAPGPYGQSTNIVGNVFVDNWAGVILWENSDRFCGSPNNTSTGYCTLVNPAAATTESCRVPGLIAVEPYIDDCRWKTANITVRSNRFVFDPSRIDPACTPVNSCGLNGIFANSGSDPPWSPYQGDVVQQHITFDQNNVFRDNRYFGPWRFMAFDQATLLSWESWRAPPYAQDSGSTQQ